MRHAAWCCALMSWLGTSVCPGAFVYRDSFDYADGSEGTPAWCATTIAWEVRDQKLLCTGGNRSLAILEKAPHAKEMTLEATVMIRERRGDGWPLAGIVVQRDGRDYWHLALVESPEDKGRRHFVELCESLDGLWLAQSAAGTRLGSLASQGRDLDWQYGRSYRLRIVLTPERIDGFVHELDGTLRTHLAFRLDNRAVTAGQPALGCQFLLASFDNVAVQIGQTAAPPEPVRKRFAPYAVPGWEKISAKPTSFFHPQQIDGRWWLIDPKGRAFYMIGTDHIRYQGHWCQKLGFAPYGRKMKAKYGTEQKWAEATAARLADWGFNTLPAGHCASLRYRRFAHIEFLSFGSSFASIDDLCPKTTWTGFPNVFSPKWSRHCEKIARRRCAPVKEDPWLIGYFLDNELEWYGKNHQAWGLFAEAWKKPATHSAKRAWIDFVKGEWKSPADFRADWGVAIADFEALAQHVEVSEPRTDRAREIAQRWVRHVAELYFKHCAAAIRRHDPNHLVLGSRFAGRAPDIWDVAGRHCDIVSFNAYPRIDVEWGVPASFVDQVRAFHRAAGKPLMITEWSFPALDSGLPCKHGAGMRVDTQAQRAACFTHFQKLMFSFPFMVGSNFFMFVDEPALGISETFPEDSNYGLVNEEDEPYAELTQAAARLNRRVYELHAAGRLPKAPEPARLVSWLKELPQQSVPVPDGPLTLAAGDLAVEGPVGAHAWRLRLGKTVLGELYPVLHMQAPENYWASPATARVVAIRRNDRVTTVDMEFSQQSPRQFRTQYRFWIPHRPAGWIGTQCLWIENEDKRPWKLGAIYHYVVPAIGGDRADDEPLDAGVPNYYRRGSAWIDGKAGAGVGCWFSAGSGFRCRYWKNPQGGFHADLRREVGQNLQPGQRYEVEGPPAFIFALREASLAGFSKAVQQVKREVLAER